MRACTKYFGNYHYSADWDPWRGSTRSHQELRPGGRDSLNFKCTSFLKNRSLDSEEEITVFLSCIVCLFKYSFSLYLTIVHRKGHSGNNLAQVTPRINMLFSVPLITAPSSLYSLSLQVSVWCWHVSGCFSLSWCCCGCDLDRECGQTESLSPEPPRPPRLV